MGTDHPPRDEQARLAKPSLWVAEPALEPRSPLENPLRGHGLPIWDGEHTENVSSLVEENARLRGLVVQLSNLILKNVVVPAR
jgi:hypothetical protein